MSSAIPLSVPLRFKKIKLRNDFSSLNVFLLEQTLVRGRVCQTSTDSFSSRSPISFSMLTCRRLIPSRFSSISLASHLFVRHGSSSADLSTILQENSAYLEKKPASTIAFETFVQTPAEAVADSLLYVHDSLALPWWATIALATCAFRVVMGVSLTVAQQRLIERLQMVQRRVNTELEPKIKFLNMQAMRGRTASVLEEKKHLKREVIFLVRYWCALLRVSPSFQAVQLTKQGYQEHNVHPGKLLILGLFGSVPWLYFTFGIRMICMSPMTLGKWWLNDC